jgi:choline dehydrogenase
MVTGYDYIVVGGGSAGCVVAARLSENPDAQVLLVEAGARDWNPLLRVPLMATFFMRKKYHNWAYLTEPEPNLNNRQIPWPRGRVLGGSSQLNGMVYIRGNRGDYDHWSQLGLRDWSYEKVLPFFQKSENFLDETIKGREAFHGTAGELPVTRTPIKNRLYDAFVDAGQQAGFRANPDFNGATQEGFGRYHFTIRDGQRWSTARSFIEPIRDRKNLTVLTGAQLLRVVVEKGRAVAVEVKSGGQVQRIAASREIVLSCGAITSPTALMHSGIGDADALKKLGIKPVANRPQVGRNLQDHLTIRVVHASETPDSLYDLRRVDRSFLAVLNALLKREGPATSMPLEGGAFIRSRPEVEHPDLQIHFFPGVPAQNGLRVPFEKPLPGVYDGYGFAGTICQTRPESRGQITLKSSDPFAAPRIQANYLATEGDKLTMRAGLKILRNVMKQDAFAFMKSREASPGPTVVTDEDHDAYVRNNAGTVYHPVGTCRMGVDPDSVLDEELRVREVEGLRIADASVMPTLISGNTNAPSIMIGEKCADYMLRAAR